MQLDAMRARSMSLTSRDVLPIQTDRQQPKSLITVRASKDASEVGVFLVSQAENGKSCKQGEDPFGEQFPYADSILMRCNVKVSSALSH